jgi:hypothetical protein
VEYFLTAIVCGSGLLSATPCLTPRRYLVTNEHLAFQWNRETLSSNNRMNPEHAEFLDDTSIYSFRTSKVVASSVVKFCRSA